MNELSALAQEKHMPIVIAVAPSRSRRIAVDVVPAEWQNYIMTVK